MFIKNFVESYSNFATQNLKDDYLKDNLEITTYVPFVKKVTYAASLAQNTMIDKDIHCFDYLRDIVTNKGGEVLERNDVINDSLWDTTKIKYLGQN